jgi:hypothetical protein
VALRSGLIHRRIDFRDAAVDVGDNSSLNLEPSTDVGGFGRQPPSRPRPPVVAADAQLYGPHDARLKQTRRAKRIRARRARRN